MLASNVRRYPFKALRLAARVVGLAACIPLGLLLEPIPAVASDATHDVVIINGTLYDGRGGRPYRGEVAIDGDRIAYAGPPRGLPGKRVIDATSKAVAPGFINVLSWSNESLLVDGLGQSVLRQGVTLEVMGEGSSMGPLNDSMKAPERGCQGRSRLDWTRRRRLPRVELGVELVTAEDRRRR